MVGILIYKNLFPNRYVYDGMLDYQIVIKSTRLIVNYIVAVICMYIILCKYIIFKNINYL